MPFTSGDTKMQMETVEKLANNVLKFQPRILGERWSKPKKCPNERCEYFNSSKRVLVTSKDAELCYCYQCGTEF